ncbi:MAG: GDP-mannose 4,6-dehydratase [Phycisphaeraceae bacterium]|nr:GDP-mannose 4,6-dehydratase [Phycisphaeraceae bacterium]
MAQRPILITGAAGFIGSSLADQLLTQNIPVIGLDNFCDFYDPAIKHRNIENAIKQPHYQIVQADLRDRQTIAQTLATHKPQAIIHLAAMAGVRPSIERPDLYTEVNLNGTVNLLDAAIAHGVEKFLFASSSSVYGNNEKAPFAESDRVDHPISPYAATKKAGELICHSYHHLNQLPITCLRFFTVFGPRQRPDLAINKFLKLVSSGQPIPVFGDGSTSRDYTFVGDIVNGIAQSLEHCSDYHIYNLGGDSPVTLNKLIATIEQVVGKSAIIDRKPMQPGDVNRTWADLSKARKELGYAPSTSLLNGITQQWQWLQSLA